MIKYAKVVNQETGLCEVGVGTNVEFYESIGMTQQDVEQSDVDGQWYLTEKCPHKTDEQKLQEAKIVKYDENDTKAEIAREGQEFTITLENEGEEVELAFDTKRGTQSDLLTALSFIQAGVTPYIWTDNNGVQFPFTTAEQIAQVSAKFMEKANVYDHWVYFKGLIDNATTPEEVKAIVIDYGINIEEN